MFKHNHYVPILKGKRAEFPALGDLHSKRRITPLLEAIPSKPATQIPQGMTTQWPNDRPYFIDFLFFDDQDDNPAPENHPLRLCFADVAARNQLAIPVTGISRSPNYQAAVQYVVAHQGRGLLLRLIPDDFEDVDELEAALEGIPGLFGVGRDKIDLLIDLGTVVAASNGLMLECHS